jgi:hypothetical protein
VRDLAERPQALAAIRALLTGAIDYAGLFPPASLSMHEAVRNYAGYARGADAWALGRFVVPISRLAELAAEARPFLDGASQPWRLSALAGPSGADEWEQVEQDAIRNAMVDAVELRARTVDDILRAAPKLPAHVEAFYEIPIGDDPAELIAAIAHVRAKAKVRTGGVTSDAFPSTEDLGRFIAACVRARVPFKATAGLHHPLRATYRLTYAPDSPRGEMFGFLNVLLAAAFAANGLPARDTTQLLAERDAAAFRFESDVVSWRGHRLTTRQVADVRGGIALSFGSCSFTEPIAELQQLGLL